MMLGGFVDLCGFVAAAMTLITFAQRTMLPMRVTALLANVFFILYGWLGPFYPVLILHVILLPVNTIRLRQIGRGSGKLTGFDGNATDRRMACHAWMCCPGSQGDNLRWPVRGFRNPRAPRAPGAVNLQMVECSRRRTHEWTRLTKLHAT